MTDSLNPEWRGGFYFRNGFELLLPIRAVAKNLSELPKMKEIVGIKTNDLFSRFVIIYKGFSFDAKIGYVS